MSETNGLIYTDASSGSVPPVYPPDAKGLKWVQKFCPKDTDPWASVEWSKRDCTINDSKGGIVFQQLGVEAPVDWSDTAVNIAASKYFYGHVGEEGRENSIRDMINRVAHTISFWGMDDGYFASYEDSIAFYNDMVWLLLHQCFAFNSPVWFNLGVDEHPAVSACYINSVDDTMESIMDLAKTEAMLFKGGSGAGVNLSKLRGSSEHLSKGGTASGPVSFMKGYDSFAGVLKSGGRVRRAAKIIILDADHPDIEEFISCKMVEEKKAHALIAAGYDGSFNAKGGAYDSIFFQNANHSVRVTDAFMEAVEEKGYFELTDRVTGKMNKCVEADELLTRMAEAAWFCGDPGLQFDTTINDWHTCPESGRIEASNPCSEYMHINDSACNLASLNLMKFRKKDTKGFDYGMFSSACALIIIAQDILVDRASYPTPKIGENARNFRQLGLGYANLGSLLMVNGLPYDSDEGRDMAARITCEMQLAAYGMSIRLAKVKGPFAGYHKNREAMLGVIIKHGQAAKELNVDSMASKWDSILVNGQAYGFRNSQVSVIAPTGTIGMLMDCPTTGIEPNFALVSYKKLVGGGYVKLVNDGVREALTKGRGYDNRTADLIMTHIAETGTIEGFVYDDFHSLNERTVAVFDCAQKPANGKRFLSPDAHLLMMAAVQPFLSGAISKTCNVPNEYTVEDIKALYIRAWKLGLKSITVYRDGCKMSQPLNTRKEEVKDGQSVGAVQGDGTVPRADASGVGKGSRASVVGGSAPRLPIQDREHAAPVQSSAVQAPFRRRLPTERNAVIHKMDIGGHEGYVTVGLYGDGTPGELFLTMSKEGSTIAGLMDAFATSVSLGLQYGVPLETLVSKFSHTRFEPSGYTGSSELGYASSLIDYIFRWLDLRFGASLKKKVEADDTSGGASEYTQANPNFFYKEPVTMESIQAIVEPLKLDVWSPQVRAVGVVTGVPGWAQRQTASSDAPCCSSCGSMMVRSGSCHRCTNCGGTSGCS